MRFGFDAYETWLTHRTLHPETTAVNDRGRAVELDDKVLLISHGVRHAAEVQLWWRLLTTDVGPDFGIFMAFTHRDSGEDERTYHETLEALIRPSEAEVTLHLTGPIYVEKMPPPDRGACWIPATGQMWIGPPTESALEAATAAIRARRA
jgi:hypothetical protein